MSLLDDTSNDVLTINGDVTISVWSGLLVIKTKGVTW